MLGAFLRTQKVAETVIRRADNQNSRTQGACWLVVVFLDVDQMRERAKRGLQPSNRSMMHASYTQRPGVTRTYQNRERRVPPPYLDLH